MTDIVIPSWIIPDQEDIQLIDDNTTKFEPQFGRGQSQRQSYGAPRFKISRKHTVRQGEEANVMASIMALRGGYNTVRTTIKRVLRGSFGLSELAGNNSFTSGTSGWAVINNSVQKVQDRISTLQIALAQTGTAAAYGIDRVVTTTQYAPHVIRAALMKGRGVESYIVNLGSSAVASDYAGITATGSGLITAAGVTRAASADFFIGGVTAVGNVYQDYSTCNHTSVSRCALTDNGANLIIQSNSFNLGNWTVSGATIAANSANSYDLSVLTADNLVEDASNGVHRVSVTVTGFSASAQDIAFTVAVKANNRSFVDIQFSGGAGAAEGVFNLSTGAVSSSAASGDWASQRASIQALGNGWYACSVVARKTGSATSIGFTIFAGTSATVFSYAGSNGSTALILSDGTAAVSASPVRMIRTGASVQAATGQSGSALLIKGLPASTDALAVTGDFIEIGGELKRITTPLNSDALGLGYLQFEPELIRSPVDNDPVIFFEPFGRFVISNVQIQPRVSDVQLSYDLEQIYE